MFRRYLQQYIPVLIFLSTMTILLYWDLGARSLWESEDRWAEITRNMLRTGDFFHPIINASIYFDKPLLSYWFIAAFASITGKLNEWATRAPSAVAGMLALYATFYLGRELWSKKVAWMAIWILLTSYGFIFWSRTASADMANLAATVAAVSWFFANKNKSTWLSYFIFYFICVVGAQTKGLTAIVVPVLAISPYICREKRWQAHCNLSHLGALGLCALLYFLPFVVAIKMPLANGYHAPDVQLNGLNLVYRENILRFFNPFDHKGNLLTYIYALPYILMPWSPLFCAAIYVGLTKIKRTVVYSRWLLESIVLIFIFFTVSGSRRWYYILPITPFCALLTAEFLLDEGSQTLKKYCFLLIKIAFAIISVLFLASPLLWKFTQYYQFVPPPALIYSTFIIGLLGCLIIFVNWWEPAAFSTLIGTNNQNAALIAASAILLGGWFCGLQPSVEAFRTERNFAQQVKEMVSTPENIVFYEHARPSMVFYLDFAKPIPILTADHLISAIKNNGRLIIIAERTRSPALKTALLCQYQISPLAEEAHFPWEKGRSNMKLIAWQMTEIKNNHEICKAPTGPSEPIQHVLPVESESVD